MLRREVSSFNLHRNCQIFMITFDFIFNIFCIPYIFWKFIFQWNYDHDTPLCDTPPTWWYATMWYTRRTDVWTIQAPCWQSQGKFDRSPRIQPTLNPLFSTNETKGSTGGGGHSAILVYILHEYRVQNTLKQTLSFHQESTSRQGFVAAFFTSTLIFAGAC